VDERRQQENCTQDRHRHVVPSLKLETKFPFLYVFLSFLFSPLSCWNMKYGRVMQALYISGTVWGWSMRTTSLVDENISLLDLHNISLNLKFILLYFKSVPI